MRVAITDANIFIDLYLLDLLELLFLLSLEIHTTKEVIDELDEEQLEFLKSKEKSGDLSIYHLNSMDYGEIEKLNLSKGLSQTDKAVYYYSQIVDCMVLSGDRKLRKTIEQSGREVHGIVWIFDEWIKAEIIQKSVAAEKMIELIRLNPFLPISECNERINRWME